MVPAVKSVIREAFESFFYSTFLTFVIVVASALIVYELLYAETLTQGTLDLFANTDYAISFFFLADYIVGLWLAANRRRYAFSGAGVLNLLSSLPFPQGALQTLRVLKILRGVRGIRIAMQGQSIYLRHKEQKRKITREFTADGLAEHNAGTLHVENEP